MKRLKRLSSYLRSGRILFLMISSWRHSSKSGPSNICHFSIPITSPSGRLFPSPMIWLLLLLFIIAHLPAHAASKSVTDQLGRSVTLCNKPQRIVSLAPSITEILFALNLGDRLVGVTQFSDYPPAAAKLIKVGPYARLDLEKIVSLKPDLCIAVKDGNPIHIVEKLETLGIAVYAVDPRSLKAIQDTVVELGHVLGAEQRAKSVADAMGVRIKKVRQKLAGVTHRPGVFFQIGISPIVSAGTPTFINELITMAGGVNLTKGPAAYPRFSTEQVIEMAPEVMIITSMARQAVFEEVKAQWQQWDNLPAVKNDRIHLVNSDIVDRASPRLVEGLELLAKLIHPTRF